MNRWIFLSVMLLSLITQKLVSQNTPWDIIYCLNGGENKSMGISKLSSPNPREKPGWNLIFSDEFQADSLDPVKWNRSTPGDDKYGSCLREFAINPENNVIENGSARILNTIDPQLPDCPYSFGEIKTMSVRDTAFKSYYFYAPGYLETRMKLFTKTGQGAACWLWGIGSPENPGTPGPWNEIDIFELNGVNTNIFNGAYHWTYNGVHVSQNHSIYLTDSSQIYDLSTNWTTFGLEWDTLSVKWFVNNHLVKELDLTKIPPYCIGAQHYNQPMAPFCLRFNTGDNTVGNQAGIPNPADFPQAMMIDYVRMYKRINHKATQIIISDGQFQICANAISPETTVKTIRIPYYPDAVYHISSPAFEMQRISSPIPQPPEKFLIWIKPGIQSGQAYPIYAETHFSSGYTVYDTAYIYISEEVPPIPGNDFIPSQIDTNCGFTIKTTILPNLLGCDFSLDNGSTWDPGITIREGGTTFCRFGKFKPEQVVDFAVRTQNGCGYSPVRYANLTMPIPPAGCKWPAGVNDRTWPPSAGFSLVVSVTPNPVVSILNVKVASDFNRLSKPVQLKIFDIHARMVASETLTSEETQLDLNYVPNGVYCLQILMNQIIIHRSSFIKQ
jgi:beta-glucanase (GH16 family)